MQVNLLHDIYFQDTEVQTQIETLKKQIEDCTVS